MNAAELTASSLFELTLRDLLASGHAARFRAEGDSMHPTIRHGDHIEVAACAGSELRRGDVVLAATSRGLTAHRILRILPEGIITRGDNAIHRDSLVEAASILGRVMEIKEITLHSRLFDELMKIIRFAAAFMRTLRKRFQQ
jgi:signal peptidase I